MRLKSVVSATPRHLFGYESRIRAATTPARLNQRIVTFDELDADVKSSTDTALTTSKPFNAPSMTSHSSLALPSPSLALKALARKGAPEAHHDALASYYFEPNSMLAPSGNAHPFSQDNYAKSAATRLSSIRDAFWPYLGSPDENVRQRAWTSFVAIEGPFNSYDGKVEVASLSRRDRPIIAMWQQPLHNQAHLPAKAPGALWPRAAPEYPLRGPQYLNPRRYRSHHLSGPELDMMSPYKHTWKAFMGRAIQPNRFTRSIGSGDVERILTMQLKLETRMGSRLNKAMKAHRFKEERVVRGKQKADEFRAAVRSAVARTAPSRGGGEA